MGRRYRTKSNATAGEAIALTCGFIVFFPAWLVFGLLLFSVFSIFSFVISFVPMIFLFKFAAESGAGTRRRKYFAWTRRRKYDNEDTSACNAPKQQQSPPIEAATHLEKLRADCSVIWIEEDRYRLVGDPP